VSEFHVLLEKLAIVVDELAVVVDFVLHVQTPVLLLDLGLDLAVRVYDVVADFVVFVFVVDIVLALQVGGDAL